MIGTVISVFLVIYVIGMIVGAGFASGYAFERKESGHPCDTKEKKILYYASILAWPYALGGMIGCTVAAIPEERSDKEYESD